MGLDPAYPPAVPTALSGKDEQHDSHFISFRQSSVWLQIFLLSHSHPI